MQAIFETGGKQFKVKTGDVITAEKLDAPEGGEIVFDKVLAVIEDGKLQVGAPYVKNAGVTAVVEKHARAKKVIVYKYKAKKGFHKKKGHRQPYTRLKIADIRV